MWSIIIALSLGIIIGYLNIIPKKYMKFNGKFQQIGVVILLFTMGISIGADKSVLNNIKSIGLKSFGFAIFTTLFSIILVYIFSNLFMKGDAK